MGTEVTNAALFLTHVNLFLCHRCNFCSIYNNFYVINIGQKMWLWADSYYILCNHRQVDVYQNMINSRLFLLPLQPNFIHSMAEYSINRIRVVLAEQNKTNRWLAEQMGKSEITISRWVQNKSQPSLEQLLQVAKLLSISPKDLINDINNTGAKNV